VRREGRRAALQLLYALEANGAWDSFDEQQRLFFSSFAAEVEGDAGELARELCRDAAARREDLDRLIEKASTNWRTERMSRVDLSILRLAAAELSGSLGTPAAVVLDEAVELAKEFGSPESPSFVNGVLNRLASSLP
jgi:transcription antitermination protein NusB